MKNSSLAYDQNGFTLITVIWAMGLLAVLATLVALSINTYSKLTANRVENAKAMALAEGAVKLAGFQVLSSLVQNSNLPLSSVPFDGTPKICRIGNRAIVRLVMSDVSTYWTDLRV